VEYYQTRSSKDTEDDTSKQPPSIPVNRLAFGFSIYFIASLWGLFAAPPSYLATAQLGAALLNSAALIPQFELNFTRKNKGDYSPTTALLASGGCLIRLFTITQLADSDPILIISFGIAFLLNTSLLLQIVYYGTVVENLSIGQVFAADISTNNGIES
jgi:hypothetical protein